MNTKGYRFKDEIAELRDGAHRVCDLELIQVIPFFPNDPLRGPKFRKRDDE